MVEFLDLKKVNAEYKEELLNACQRVIESGWYVLGKEVEEFEKKFSEYNNSSYCVGVANGLDALTLTLRSWIEMGKLKAGDKVLIPANTYIASVLAVTHSGLTPVLIDVDCNTFNLTPECVYKAIDQYPEAKVLLAVHLYGRCCPMDELMPIAESRGMLVLEDVAQAHGASVSGIKAGNWGNASCYSFYPGKNLGALGDGGAVCTDDEQLALMVRNLGNYGSSKRYVHDYKGVNSRLDEIQAAMLSVKLDRLDESISFRRSVALRYLSEIKNKQLVLPYRSLSEYRSKFEEHVFHLFVVKVMDRANFVEHLKSNNINVLIHYPTPIHLQHAYKGEIFYGNSDVDDLHNQVVSLPISPVMSHSEVSCVISACNTYEAS